MWALFEDGELHPDYELTGDFELDTHQADTDAVLEEIKAVLAEEESRRERLKAAELED
jgi:RIO kinase 1